MSYEMPKTWRAYTHQVLANMDRRDKQTKKEFKRAMRYVSAVYGDEWLGNQFQAPERKEEIHPLVARVVNRGAGIVPFFIRFGRQIEIVKKMGKLKSFYTRLYDPSPREFTSVLAEFYWIQQFFEAGHTKIELEAPLPTGKRSDLKVKVNSKPVYVEVKTVVERQRMKEDMQMYEAGNNILGQVKKHCSVNARLDHRPSKKDFSRLQEYVKVINSSGLPVTIREEGWTIDVDPLFEGAPETMTINFRWKDEELSMNFIRQLRSAMNKFPDEMDGPVVIVLNAATSGLNILDEELHRGLKEEMRPVISAALIMEPRHPYSMGELEGPLLTVLVRNENANVDAPDIPTAKERRQFTKDEIERLTESVVLVVHMNIEIDKNGRRRIKRG